MTPYQAHQKYLKEINHFTRPKSEETAEDRKKMAFISRFLEPFLGAIDYVFPYGFTDDTNKQTGIEILNIALRDNTKIVGGIIPNLRINYHELLISKGLLAAPVSKLFQYKETIARLEWDNSNIGRGRKDDNIVWMQYNATTNETLLWCEPGIRNRGYCDIKMNVKILNDELHYWMFFSSLNRKQRSNSVYLGQLNTSIYTPGYYVNPRDTEPKEKMTTAEKI